MEIFLFSWNSYKINQTQDKIGVFVSIVSTKIPFKGTGKEYIGDDISEIASAVKVGIWWFDLGSYHWNDGYTNSIIFPDFYPAVLPPAKIKNSEENSGSWAAGEKTEFKQVQPKSLLCPLNPTHDYKTCGYSIIFMWINFFGSRYIPDATGAIYDVLKEMAHSHVSKKKRYEAEDAELLRKVSARLITKDTLSGKLAQHVEQVRSLVLLIAADCFGSSIFTITDNIIFLGVGGG